MKRTITALLMALLFTIGARAAEPAVPEQVMAVGKAVGIEVRCSGLMIVGFSEESAARESGMRPGDIIEMVDGRPVTEPGELRALLQNKSQVTLTALRGSRERCFLVPLLEAGGMKLLGANVKTQMAGVGTVTYYDPATAVFGALGHGITDEATGELFPVQGGYLCKATILRADRGRAGVPGMLQGAFDSGELLGTVTANRACGIFGVMARAPEGEMLPVAQREEVRCGPAEVLCNVDGDRVERYSLEIARIYSRDDGTGRNMMLRVTDQRLLQRTGGIVQGMSGSPILQDGKLIGAVTHVLVADPEVGYGIFIETMLEAGMGMK